MTELELTRSPDDRRLYLLGSLGALRFDGLGSRSATAEAGGRTWRFARRGLLRTIEATDAAGTTTGAFAARILRGGGTLTWSGSEYTLRPTGLWRRRYELAENERGLAVLDGKGWGKRPVTLLVADSETIEAGLLLFAAWVVHQLAGDAATAAAAGSTAAVA
jgi:hypothetical protein